jgi:hypothetical protein
MWRRLSAYRLQSIFLVHSLTVVLCTECLGVTGFVLPVLAHQRVLGLCKVVDAYAVWL